MVAEGHAGERVEVASSFAEIAGIDREREEDGPRRADVRIHGEVLVDLGPNRLDEVGGDAAAAATDPFPERRCQEHGVLAAGLPADVLRLEHELVRLGEVTPEQRVDTSCDKGRYQRTIGNRYLSATLSNARISRSAAPISPCSR